MTQITWATTDGMRANRRLTGFISLALLLIGALAYSRQAGGPSALAWLTMCGLALINMVARFWPLQLAAHSKSNGEQLAELTELTRHLQTVREDERKRLAIDLHDELGALLTSAKLDAARVRFRLGDAAPHAREHLVHLVATLDQVMALKQRITQELWPSALTHLGLVSTLEILARDFEKRTGVHTVTALQPVRLTPTAELMVYRLVQEALTNISKHARARLARIKLEAQHGVVTIQVTDDGVGFDTLAPHPAAYGLMGMRVRVEAEGGAMSLVSAPRHGTMIEAQVPQRQAPRSVPPSPSQKA